MMEINLHTVLTLEDDEKYVVVAKIEYEGNYYDYLLQLTDDEEDVTDQVEIVKEEKENDEIYIDEIIDEELLKKLTPLFQKQLEEKRD